MPPTVLCVDDDKTLCQSLAKALAAEGYSVATAHDCDEALAKFKQKRPDFVFLDLVLPKGDGFQVLEGIRAAQDPSAPVPVALVSGCSQDDETTRRAFDLDVKALLTKPVPLDQLLALPAEHVKDKTADAAVGGNGLPAAGSLISRAFPELLSDLSTEHTTGVLHVKNGRKQKWLQLEDGCPTAVKSNLRRECLGDWLLRQGRISAQIMEESIKRMREGEGLQGQILVAMRSLTLDDLKQALRSQSEEKIYEIFEWGDGQFRLELGGRLSGASPLDFRGNAVYAILDGVRRRYPLERVDGYLRTHGDARVTAGPETIQRLFQLGLNAGDTRFVRKVEQAKSLGDLLKVNEENRRLLYGLLATHLLELSEAPPPESAESNAAVAADPGATQPMGPAAGAAPKNEQQPLDDEGRRAVKAELEFQRGQAKMRSRDYAGAMACFETAVELFPDEGEYRVLQGWAFFLDRKEQPEAAEKALRIVRQGAKLARDRDTSYLILGRLYRELNRLDMSEKMFERALDIRPDCVEAQRELRLLQMRRRKEQGLIGRWLRR